MNYKELARQLEEEGRKEIDSFKQCPSYLNFRDNVDMIGEEENFAVHRTIDAEHRRFHGELKRTAEVQGRNDMLVRLVYRLKYKAKN